MKKTALTIASCVVAILTIGALSGCANVKEYSVRSYDGIIPLKDHRYVHADGAVAAPPRVLPATPPPPAP